MRYQMTAKFWWRQQANQLLNWIFPGEDALCVVCGRPSELGESGNNIADGQHGASDLGMCPFCQQEAASCTVNAAVQNVRLDHRRGFVAVHSCVSYEQFLRTLIRAWKYDGLIQLTEWFGQIMLSALPQALIARCDLIVPVPATRDRIQKRGYDHTRLLAACLSDAYGLPLIDGLCRVQTDQGFTQSQTAKSALARRRGLKNAYVLNAPLQTAMLRRKRLLLIDDIVTTGSTIATCAQALYQAGAATVEGGVIARVM